MSSFACSSTNQRPCHTQESNDSHESACAPKGDNSKADMAHELLMKNLEQGMNGDQHGFDCVSKLLNNPKSGVSADTPFDPKKDINVKDTPELCMAYLNGDLEGVNTLGELQQALTGAVQTDPSATASPATSPFSSQTYQYQDSPPNTNQSSAALVGSKYANLVTPGAMDAALPASIMPFTSAPQASTTAYDQGYNTVDKWGSNIAGAADAVTDDATSAATAAKDNISSSYDTIKGAATGAVNAAKDKTASAADNAVNSVLY